LSDRETEECLKFVNTGLIDRWALVWGTEPLTHQRVQFLTPYLQLNNAVLSEKRINQYMTPKIIFSKNSKYPESFWDVTGEYASANTNFVYAKNSNYSLGYLSAILNSCLTALIYKVYFGSLVMSGGYFQFQSPQLKVIPIRKIDFVTPNPRRQQALESAIALYNQYQTNGNPELVLAEVRLSQQPEEADVIHDLLAYLAEQMLELNKQKQGEIKDFLQWLERFIGCHIDQLANKTKIQNYLGDYYKDEPYLRFDDLIAVLKRNKGKLTIEPVARTEQETLAKEYQATLDTLLPLKMQLMRCDNLIDAIVYQLYGLTEEEIAIVNRKK